MAGKVGVLALQGDYEAHRKAIESVGGQAIEVRTKADLDSIDGLIIPGGESTTMLRLLREENLFEPLKDFGTRKPVFGTCAGAILLAKTVENPQQESLGLLDIDVQRNAYGRQIDSHIASIAVEDLGNVEAVFIRAPIIRRTGPEVQILAEHRGDPVLVRQGNHFAATFHPELTKDHRLHQLFLENLT